MDYKGIFGVRLEFISCGLMFWFFGVGPTRRDSFCLSFSLLEIKLKEYGSETIEVNDNGSGVDKENFEGLSKYELYLF